jgi:excisionase family DNA binding protein
MSGISERLLNERAPTAAVSTPKRAATVTVEQAAEILGVSRSLAYEAVRNGRIPSLRIGRRWLIPRQALERLLVEADGG